MSKLSHFLRRVMKPKIHQTKTSFSKTGFSIGEHSYGVPIVRSWGEGATLRIGKYCSIADEVKIFLGGNHRTDWISTYPFCDAVGWPNQATRETAVTKGDVHIGNDVWIGSGATILSGVQLGDGCVVGAMAVVTKNVAPYQIVAGNPARVVKSRFDDDTIQSLLDVSWWNWEDEKVRKFVPYLMSGDVSLFLSVARGETPTV